MIDITDNYKNEQKMLKALEKIKNDIQRRRQMLQQQDKANSWVCKKCKCRFLKPTGLNIDNTYNSWNYVLPNDIDIIIKRGRIQTFSEWTFSGYDYYEAEVADISIKCPCCGEEEWQYGQRLSIGKRVDSKDSWQKIE